MPNKTAVPVPSHVPIESFTYQGATITGAYYDRGCAGLSGGRFLGWSGDDQFWLLRVARGLSR